jgi:hypothetical protein
MYNSYSEVKKSRKSGNDLHYGVEFEADYGKNCSSTYWYDARQ